MSSVSDVVVVGAGIVGLATAYKLLSARPELRVRIVEKEDRIAQHQSSHNSGVLHTGVYYRPGSLRALNCTAGRIEMVEFCEHESVAYEVCGKVIVAVNEGERERLQGIFSRGVANGVACEMIGPERLREIEPHVQGVEAIHVPEAGIVDYPGVASALARRITEMGGEIITSRQVLDLDERHDGVRVGTDDGDLAAGLVVTCGGLHSDRLAEMTSDGIDAQILPFRGEYYELKAEARHLCRHLIYPVPDPSFPFLGVHLTRMVAGGVECGPNAVLALAREGYDKGQINWKELAESASYPGFLRLAARHWKAGLREIHRSYSRAAFARSLQRLVPEIREDQLVTAPAGVRAQAVDRGGRIVDDFLFRESERVVHVCNAPSPAATASLRIGWLIVDRLSSRLDAFTGT